MSVNVEELSREQLENIVIQQSKQLKAFEARDEHQTKQYQKLEGEYDNIASILMHARGLLNSGLTENPEDIQDEPEVSTQQ